MKKAMRTVKRGMSPLGVKDRRRAPTLGGTCTKADLMAGDLPDRFVSYRSKRRFRHETDLVSEARFDCICHRQYAVRREDDGFLQGLPISRGQLPRVVKV